MSKKTLINETVIRRWGQLANLVPLTETWLSEQDDEEEAVEAGAEDELAAEEDEMDVGIEDEAVAGEADAVERIVSAVVSAIADETGVAIEVEGEAAGSEGDEEPMDAMGAEMEVGAALDGEADAEMDDADPAMRAPYNRKDITERGGKKGDEGAGKDEDDEDYSGDGMRKGDKSKTHAGVDETIDLDVIDDTHLTEAVLKRVVERLLRLRRK